MDFPAIHTTNGATAHLNMVIQEREDGATLEATFLSFFIRNLINASADGSAD